MGDQWSPIMHCFLYRGSKQLQVVQWGFKGWKGPRKGECIALIQHSLQIFTKLYTTIHRKFQIVQEMVSDINKLIRGEKHETTLYMYMYIHVHFPFQSPLCNPNCTSVKMPYAYLFCTVLKFNNNHTSTSSQTFMYIHMQWGNISCTLL